MKYVGLTDNPSERKEAHGNPGDWKLYSFSNEKSARDWEKGLLANPEYKGGPGGGGWKYGYTYTITTQTTEN